MAGNVRRTRYSRWPPTGVMASSSSGAEPLTTYGPFSTMVMLMGVGASPWVWGASSGCACRLVSRSVRSCVIVAMAPRFLSGSRYPASIRALTVFSMPSDGAVAGGWANR